MEILQLSYRDGQTTIVWRQENTSGGLEEHYLVSSDIPRPEMIAALQGLTPHLISYCGLSPEDARGTMVHKMVLSYDKVGVPSVKLDALHAVQRQGKCITIRTNKLAKEGVPGWTDEFTHAIDNAIKEAEHFIKGDRAQMKIDFGIEGGDGDAGHPD